jgi:hypothetical protein
MSRVATSRRYYVKHKEKLKAKTRAYRIKKEASSGVVPAPYGWGYLPNLRSTSQC